MSIRSILLFLLLALAAVGSWYLARMDRGNDVTAAQQTLAQPGYYLKSARILGTADDGSLLYEITTKFAEQEGDGSIACKDVNIHYSPGSDVPWSVVADNASIYADARRITLSGDVRAFSDSGFNGKQTELKTDFLEVDPDTFKAQTDAHVQISIGLRSLTATGMLASLKDDQLELKSNVSGNFLP